MIAKHSKLSSVFLSLLLIWLAAATHQILSERGVATTAAQHSETVQVDLSALAQDNVVLTGPLVLADRVVNLTGKIDTNTDVTSQIRFLAAQHKPIYLLINSTGGLVFMAQGIVQAMQDAANLNAPVVCIVTKQAASAAFEIVLPGCAERYAHPSAVLAFHRIGFVSVGTYLTVEDLLERARDLSQTAEEVMAFFYRSLPIRNEDALVWLVNSYTAELEGTAVEMSKQEYLRDWFTVVSKFECTAPIAGLNCAAQRGNGQ